MPSSGKRAQRPRREPMMKVDIPDSSPSRPSKRRKKTEEPKTNLPSSNQLPRDPPTSEMDKEEVISRVTQILGLPGFVQVRQDHGDEKHTKESRGGIAAFAKLAGRGWTYYLKDMRINVGRHSAEAEGQDEGPIIDVHVDLGPSKMISRRHASIFYSQGWRMEVSGRNGVRVDNRIFRRNEVADLYSGAIIDISGVEMMFVLPDGDFKIDPTFLRRSELSAEDTEDARRHREETPDVLPPPSTNGARGQNGAPQAIAPAPQGYQRPGTPPPASRIKIPGSNKRSPPAYSAGGTMVMNDSESVDLSLDSNAHIKPGYSYSQMIAQAIIGTPGETLVLNGIYQYIMRRYAYYRHQPPHGWQNSIRHNLSLNSNYDKTPRGKDEPGKGMKWFIKEERYKEMKALASSAPGRGGGHRGSSQPASPMATVDRGFTDEFSPESAVKEKRSPSSGSPRMNLYPPQAPQYTPERAPRVQVLQDDLPGDGSPLPRHRRAQKSTLGLSDNIPGSPPILSSSYQQDEGNTFVTPAPHRVHPHLAPPSTAQRPSQHMPTSSPAPFWRFAGDTPLRGFSVYDVSPIKGFQPGVLPSSSPPPMRRNLAMSPTRNSNPGKHQISNDDELEEEEEQGYDLTRGFQTIGSYHAPAANLVTPSARI
ncbi:hypothetical protein sscle_06g049780 [Sclerotinia sclerotiorum 1980 UF-70]|uniref:Uncharacterized protein n=1 Tax=Sclerotinia sclerotiorum (strain ATCC 18683 / 1980 / Ss-1) TaxID=665079 RepID=A0A1D9Q5I7_SCLS1|nr:hypothetical protein sscle_06g049780 [Sclerotinia sclerotiorum 1980 UF-70]